MNEDLKYLDYEGLQDFKQRLDLQIQNEKDLILTEITNIGNSKADIDDISPEVIIEDANGHEYVEIAGIKWATCNVGANNPDDEGLYFAWGENTGYDSDQVGTDKNFSQDDYELTEDGGSTMSKYNSTDEKTVLELEDDAAAVNMGGSWRIPTTEEWQVLGEAVYTEWTNNYNDTGVSGLICTDKTDNSKVLFFPAAGLCQNGNTIATGITSNYWSSSLSIDFNNYAHCVNFGSDFTTWQNSFSRSTGYSVRGVLGTVQQKILGTTITDAERSYWNGKADISNIPTNVSELTNDSGYLTSHQSLADYATKQEVNDKIGNLGNQSEAMPAQGTEGEPDYVPAQDAVPHTVKSYVDKKISDLIGEAPETLDTLKEIADQLSDNGDIISTLTNTIENKADKSDLTDLEQTIIDNEQVTSAALTNLEETKANKSDLNAIEQTIEDNELVVSTALNNLREKSLISVVNITTDTSSSCTITGVSNSEREQLIIYKNASGSSDLIVTVPTIYFTPNGQPIELICKIGGYCEVNYINVDGNIYARGL